ncbi:sensor histidine kinase [Alteromonas gracilis]|uniref:sensor histidine kinase n=1 Tax=Alteromonas gracilis TaxID=1479524 RepID=UPI0030CE50F0
MSDSNSFSEQEKIDSLEARVKSLERQLKRQKIARKNAESLLDTYSQDAYLANQSLRKSLNDAKKRERELLYLNRTAAQLTKSQSGKGFIFSALASAVEFIGACCGKAYIVKNGALTAGDDDTVLLEDGEWQSNPELAKLLLNELPIHLEENYEHWCINVVDRPDTHQEARVLHFMHEVNEDEYAWFALLTYDDHLDEEMLYVLDTTKHYINFNSRYQHKKSKLSIQQDELSSVKKDRDSLEERLISADKMAMLGQLAAGIAHEINNPIGYVRSNTVVAKEIFSDYQHALDEIGKLCDEAGGEISEKFNACTKGYSLNESAIEIAEMFDESLEGIERIIDIVKALRSFSYPGSGKHVKLSAIDAINSAMKLTSNLHRYKNHVSLVAEQGDVSFMGNAGQIQQVLVNFLTNAIYATEEGKHIYLRVERKGDKALLIVQDEGVGMSQVVLEKVFTPFFTTKPPGDGTGLGMSISMTIVEEHGGFIDIKSEEGVGTEVTLQLPLV